MDSLCFEMGEPKTLSYDWQYGREELFLRVDSYMNEMEYRTIGKALAGGYRAAVYCRLSKDDDLQGESASIANQRDMLEKYCER